MNSYQGEDILTPLHRPSPHAGEGGMLIGAATPLHAEGEDILATPPARRVIGQQMAAWIVFHVRQILVVLLAVLCIISCMVLGWVLIEFVKHEKEPCDVSLSLYVKVWVVLWVVGVWKREVHKCLVRWNPNDGPPPLRVQIMDMIHIGIVHIWVVVGIYLIASSRTCAATNPKLFLAVKWWVHLQAIVLLISSLAIVASRTLVFWLRRHTALAIGVRPYSSIVDNMTEIKFSPANPELLDEKGEIEHCAVCQEAFDDKLRIVRTPCHHIFHEKCLAEWCVRNPICPLCRRNLLAPGNGGGVRDPIV